MALCALFLLEIQLIGQLNLDRFEFWQPTSQCLMLDVCLLDDSA
nr:DUF645 family protein [Vibrio sp. gvc]